jgi:hypothetical protein
MYDRNKSLGQLLQERVSRHIQDLRNEPDPWSAEDEEALQDPEACPVCPHCLLPVSPTDHFCPECNASVGDYNNLMPFERIFAQGEVLRNGVDKQAHLTPYRLTAFGLIGLILLGPFAPLYWFGLYRNWNHHKQANSEASG